MKLVHFKQMGGEMAPAEDPQAQGQAAPGGAPQEGGGEDPTAQIQQLAQGIIQELGPEGAMMLAQMIQEMLQGGGGQPTEEQPVFAQNGAVLRKRNGR